MWCRHFDASIGKSCRELLHGVFVTVNKKRSLRTGLLLPCQEFSLVGMGGEPVDRVDASSNWNILAEYVHLLGAVDDAARKSPDGCVADEHDA